MTAATHKDSSFGKGVLVLILLLAILSCRGEPVASSVPEPQAEPAATAGSVDSPLPANAAPEIQEVVALVATCEKFENLLPVRDAWDELCDHVDAPGAEAAAEIIEDCRSAHIERTWAKLGQPDGDRTAFNAGLRDAFEGEDHDLSQPLELVLCPGGEEN